MCLFLNSLVLTQAGDMEVEIHLKIEGFTTWQWWKYGKYMVLDVLGTLIKSV